MNIIIKKKDSFDLIQLNGVSNIAYDSGSKIYTITHSGGTSTFSSDNYYLSVFLI